MCIHCIRSELHIVFGLAGRLFNTLFGTQAGDQQQPGPSSEPNPQGPSEFDQGYARAGTETAATGTHATEADSVAEAGLADAVGADGIAEAGSADADADVTDDNADCTSRDGQTGYAEPTAAGFAPGMQDMPLHLHLMLKRACACVLLLINTLVIVNATFCSETLRNHT